MTLKDLQAAFRFTGADLAANREGCLTPGQLRKIRSRDRLLGTLVITCVLPTTGIWMVILLGVRDSLSHVIALLIMLAASIYPVLLAHSQLGKLAAILFGLVWAGFTIVLALFDIQTFNSIAAITMIPVMLSILVSSICRMLLNHSVNIAEYMTGKIALYAGNGSTLSICGKTFSITGKQVLALHNGGIYTVYFPPNVPVILSIEPAEAESGETVDAPLGEKTKRKRLTLGDDGELTEV